MEPPAIKTETTIQQAPVSQMLKQAAELITLIAVSSYAFGFIIVNSYLLSYGNTGAEFFKVKYISAGTLFLLIAGLIAISFSAIFWARIQKDELESNRRNAILWAHAFALFILSFLFSHISDTDIRQTANQLPWPSWASLVVFGVCLVGITIADSSWEWRGARWVRKHRGSSYLVLFFMYALMHMNVMTVTLLGFIAFTLFVAMRWALNEIPFSVRFKEWPITVIFEVSMSIVFLLIAVGAFGTYVYGHILPQYGGGKPARVRVVLAQDKRDQLKRLGYQDGEMLLADTLLIDSTDKEWLFLLRKAQEDNGLLLQLRKDLVDAVLYYPVSR